MEKSFTADEIKAGIELWLKDRRDNPAKFLSHEKADKLDPVSRAKTDAETLIYYINQHLRESA